MAPTPLKLGFVADDYTGASDLANTLTRAGLRTVQTIGIPEGGLALPEVDAVVIALKIRSVPAAEAVAAAKSADAWLRARGAGHVMYKICSTFDSTDAGNIGPVLEALAAGRAGVPVVVTPAFPELGRSVYLGHLFVGQIPLAESPLKDHPLNPMRDSNLVGILSRQMTGKVGLLDLRTMASGPAAVQEHLRELGAKGFRAVIADAVLDDNLIVLGAAILSAPFSVGASGLGFGLARVLVNSGKVAPIAGDATLGPVGGHSAILAGSCSAATLEQIAIAERGIPAHHLDTAALLDGSDVAAKALDWAAERLASGPVLIAASAAPERVQALQARHGRDASGQAIERASAAIGEGLVKLGVRRLVVAGGETSGAVVDRLGLKAFQLGSEIAPGVPLLRTVGAPRPMMLALKSGNFGGPDFFERALAMMH